MRMATTFVAIGGFEGLSGGVSVSQLASNGMRQLQGPDEAAEFEHCGIWHSWVL